jgi:hypothetical protein
MSLEVGFRDGLGSFKAHRDRLTAANGPEKWTVSVTVSRYLYGRLVGQNVHPVHPIPLSAAIGCVVSPHP